jgi:hypothetical protein
MIYFMALYTNFHKFSAFTKYFYVNKINTNEMRGHVAHMGDRRGVHDVLVGKGKRHFENLSVDEG